MTSEGASGSGIAGKSVANARRDMRDLHQNLLNSKAEYTSTSSSMLGKTIDVTNQYFEVLKNDSRGAAIDAQVLSTASMLGAEQAANLDKVTPGKYVAKLLAAYGFSQHTKINWLNLAREISEAGIFSPVPAPTFLLGKFVAPERKEKKERKKKEEASSEPLQTADQVSVDKLQEQTEDKAQVVRIRVLQETLQELCDAEEAAGRPRRVNLFHLLVHPSSFSQTVENFFDFGFLIKDGDARLLPEAECMYTQTALKPKTDDYKAGTLRVQNILMLDHATWKALVKRWYGHGEKPLLPPRTEGRGVAGRSNGGSTGGGRGGKKRAAAPDDDDETDDEGEGEGGAASARKQARR